MGAPQVSHVIGVDLGGSKVRAVLTDLDGIAVAEASAATPGADADAVIARIVALCAEIAGGAGIERSRIRAGAVGVPGVADPGDGTLRLAPNLPPFGERHLGAALAAELGFPVTVDNDVNMATVGEHRCGGGGAADFVFIAVGTGIGMGIVAGGRLVRGAGGAAGEIGALPIGADPFDPGNQVRGPLEVGASGFGIGRRYEREAGLAPGSVTAADVFARAHDGDGRARAALDEQAATIAMAVVAVQSVLDPALVVFGGGIGIREDFVASVVRHLPRLTGRAPAVRISALGERAGLVGAAEVAREQAALLTEAVR